MAKAAIFTRSKPDLPTNEEIYSWGEELVNLTMKYPQYRRYGTEGNRAAARWIADKLKSFGIENVEEQFFSVDIKEYTDYHLYVDRHEIPAFFMQGAAYTGPEGITKELVYVGDRIDPNVDYTDKIVVMDLISQANLPCSLLKEMALYAYDPENFMDDTHSCGSGVPTNFPVGYYAAADHGAAGFIGIFCDFLTGNPENYPDPTYRVHTRIPGMYLGKYEGEKLVARLQKGETVTASIVLQGEDKTTLTSNVVAILPGQKEDSILLDTHHDAAFAGAVQDASGVITLLGIAKYFTKIPNNFRQKTLLFVFDSAHFDFNYPMGANKFRDMNPELFSHVALSIGVEHVAAYCEETKDGFIPTGGPEPRYIFTPPNNQLIRICKNAIEKNNMVRTLIPPIGSITFLGETQSYFLRNVPSFSMMAGPKYLFASDDTLDKLPKEHLQSTVGTFVDIVDGCMYLPPAWIAKIDNV